MEFRYDKITHKVENLEFELNLITFISPEGDCMIAVVDEDPILYEVCKSKIQELNDFDKVFEFFKENNLTILQPTNLSND